MGWLGCIAAVLGFALFFSSLSPFLSKRQRFFWSGAWAAAVQMIQLSWMTSIEFQGYYILLVYLFLAIGVGCQFGWLALLVPAEGKISAFRMVCCASFWTLMEWVRLFFMCGFSWNPIGLALTYVSYSLQFATVFGVFGLSFWVMLTNLSVLNFFRLTRTKVKGFSCLFLACIPYLFGVVHFAYYLPKKERQEQTMHIGLVQTALLPSEKIPHPGKEKTFLSPYLQWERVIAGLKQSGSVHFDFIVMPEAFVPLQSDRTVYVFETIRAMLVHYFGPEIEKSFPVFSSPFAESKTQLCVSNLFLCQTLANYFGAEVVAGLDHIDAEAQQNFNAVFYLQPGGSRVARYDKRVLLPLAEYLPFDFLKPLVKNYGIFEFFSKGRETKIFGKKMILSPSVCYEETFPAIMREGRAAGAQLFVNVTNDNYFPYSILHYQHLFHARVRAVENGIPLVRSCNSGVSAAVDSFGRIVAKLEPSKEGILNCHLSSYAFPTLYSFWGDYCLIGFCLVVCLCACGIKKNSTLFFPFFGRFLVSKLK